MILKTKINAYKLKIFCDNHPHANIFQTPEMYEVYKKTRNYEPVYVIDVDVIFLTMKEYIVFPIEYWYKDFNYNENINRFSIKLQSDSCSKVY